MLGRKEICLSVSSISVVRVHIAQYYNFHHRCPWALQDKFDGSSVPGPPTKIRPMSFRFSKPSHGPPWQIPVPLPLACFLRHEVLLHLF